MSGDRPPVRLYLDWSCEVECYCGAVGWERGWVTDRATRAGIGTVSRVMGCTCEDRPRGDKWGWLYGYPEPGVARGEADTFAEALTALMRVALRGES